MQKYSGVQLNHHEFCGMVTSWHEHRYWHKFATNTLFDNTVRQCGSAQLDMGIVSDQTAQHHPPTNI